MSALDDNLKAAFNSENGWNIKEEIDKINSRHPSSAHMMRVLAPNPNLKGELYSIANEFFDMAYNMFQMLPDGPELTAGLRKLLEAKDCFVRAALDKEPVDYRDR